MDVLSTKDWPSCYINTLIRQTEKKYPQRIADNKAIRHVSQLEQIRPLIQAQEIDVNAALISTCNSDMLNCGRCAFWRFARDNGINVQEVISQFSPRNKDHE